MSVDGTVRFTYSTLDLEIKTSHRELRPLRDEGDSEILTEF